MPDDDRHVAVTVFETDSGGGLRGLAAQHLFGIGEEILAVPVRNSVVYLLRSGKHIQFNALYWLKLALSANAQCVLFLSAFHLEGSSNALSEKRILVTNKESLCGGQKAQKDYFM